MVQFEKVTAATGLDGDRLTGHTWHTARKLWNKLEEKGILQYIKRKD
jgi:hypothetical protein